MKRLTAPGTSPISTTFLPVLNPTAPLLPMQATTRAKITPVALKKVLLKWVISIELAEAILHGIQRTPAKAAARKTWLKPGEQGYSIALRSINIHLPGRQELTDALETSEVFYQKLMLRIVHENRKKGGLIIDNAP